MSGTHPDPVQLFDYDRSRAGSLNDPLANVCYLATITDAGDPTVRTLVTREVEGRVGVFMNASSPKFREIGNSSAVTVLMHFPSIAIQYRMHTGLTEMDGETVQQFWMNRPQASKKMDWLYSSSPQSSTVESRTALLNRLSNLDAPNRAPPSATGFYFDPILSIERLALDQPDHVHDRTKYVLDGSSWKVFQLVP